MNFLNELDNNSILLIPNNIKNKVLDYINDNNILKSIKIMSFNDLKKGLLFDYNNEAINYVMNNYHVTYTIAKNYINNTYYLLDNSYKNDKLNNILNIKNDLDNNNLLIKDELFINLLKSKNKIYVYGFDYINKFNNYLLDIVKKYKEVIIINKETNDYKHIVYELDTMEEEVIFVCEEISKLISNGIPLNKIFIANYSNDYYYTIHKYFKLYGIPYYVRCETKLYDTVMGKYFIDNLNNNLDYLLYKIRIKFDVENNIYAENLYNRLTNLVNNYYWCDDILSIKDLIIAEMNNINISSNHYEEEIEAVNITDNIFNDDEYIFLIGFNLGSIPVIKKDEDYINDDIKTNVMETSKEMNVINKDIILKVLKNIKNITITFKKSTPFNTYFPSFIIDNYYLVLEHTNVNYSNYSDEVNKLLYSTKLDDLLKFNEHDESLDILHSNYKIDYKNYTNKFTGVDNSEIINILNNKKLSYSTISNYYKCPFRFYLSFVHRLDKYEQTLDTFIGSLFHSVMEECITDESKNIDIVYDNYIKDNLDKRVFTRRDLYFVEKVRDEVHFIVENIREQYKKSNHDKLNEWHEKSLEFKSDELDLDTKVNFILTGIIDKVLFVDNKCVIIDYKTGTSDKIDRNLFEFGYCIQLPIYLYLLKNLNKDFKIIGMYLQHILEGLIRRDTDNNDKKSIEEIRLNRLKLDGITLADTESIKLFDNEYDSNSYIQGVALKNDGDFRWPGRMMTYEEQDEIYNLIKSLLETAINNIGDANFDIKPIYIEQKADGCKYCKYKDICFVRPSDINYQEIKKNGSDDDE